MGDFRNSGQNVEFECFNKALIGQCTYGAPHLCGRHCANGAPFLEKIIVFEVKNRYFDAPILSVLLFSLEKELKL